MKNAFLRIPPQPRSHEEQFSYTIERRSFRKNDAAFGMRKGGLEPEAEAEKLRFFEGPCCAIWCRSAPFGPQGPTPGWLEPLLVDCRVGGPFARGDSRMRGGWPQARASPGWGHARSSRRRPARASGPRAMSASIAASQRSAGAVGGAERGRDEETRRVTHRFGAVARETSDGLKLARSRLAPGSLRARAWRPSTSPARQRRVFSTASCAQTSRHSSPPSTRRRMAVASPASSSTSSGNSCGVLSHGFARVRCGDCAYERLVPFSCKGRAVCTSCGGRRMMERASHLVAWRSGRSACAGPGPLQRRPELKVTVVRVEHPGGSGDAHELSLSGVDQARAARADPQYAMQAPHPVKSTVR